MRLRDIFFKSLILIIGVIFIAFYVLLYYVYEKQKTENETIKQQQQIEAQVNEKKFKYQQDQIERTAKDLQAEVQLMGDYKDSLAQQKDGLAAQKDALLQEIEKRQQIDNENKLIGTILGGYQGRSRRHQRGHKRLAERLCVCFGSIGEKDG